MWTLTKVARLIFGFGTDTQCTNCTTNEKTLAIAYLGENCGASISCVTAGQTNQSLALNVGTHNRYQFDSNGIWLSRDWQGKSTQSFTNYGKKIVGVYNCYQESGCTSGLTTRLHWCSPRIEVSSVIDNGLTFTINLRGSGDQKIGETSYLQLQQEINGVWSNIGSLQTVPSNVQSSTNGYVPTASVTIDTIQSNVPLHFRCFSNSGTILSSGTYADMWVEARYEQQYTPPYTPPQNEDLVKFGETTCKITNYKCIGRFNDVPYLEQQQTKQLVNILATNNDFFSELINGNSI